MIVTAATVAAALAAIAEEHGVPNGASLDEIAGAHHRLAVARVLLWDLPAVNAALAPRGIVATYTAASRIAPASIGLEVLP